jgi:hypothetical protein
MVDVQNCQLKVNHTFPNKEILVMRVVKEANLQGINFVCTRSDLRDFKCTGPRFCVIGRHLERLGWLVSVANIHECDEFGGDVVDVDPILEKFTLPFRTKWIVPLILVMNAANITIGAATAFCPVNATMLTIKTECRRFKIQQKNAWLLNNDLTPRGDKEYSNVFNGVNYQDFTINILDLGNEAWECTVIRRLVSGVAKHKVITPK